MAKEFTLPEAQKILDVKRNALQQWLDMGFVYASINRSSRQGDPNLFSEKDLICIKLFMYLLESGLNRKKAGEIIEFLYRPLISMTFDLHFLKFFYKENSDCDKLLFYIAKSKDKIHDPVIVLHQEKYQPLPISTKDFFKKENIYEIDIIDISKLIYDLNI